MCKKIKNVLITLGIIVLVVLANVSLHIDCASATDDSQKSISKKLQENKNTYYYPTNVSGIDNSKDNSKNKNVTKKGAKVSVENKNTRKLSGIYWCKKYKSSSDLKDLQPDFRDRASKFIKSMRKAGVNVKVMATLRTEQSCYLFHYAWLVSKGMIRPEDVPLRDDVKINWCHPYYGNSITAAQKMVFKWNLAFEPALYSNHIGGRAIDMEISWYATSKDYIEIDDAKGVGYIITTSKAHTDPATDTLNTIAKSYGIYNLKGDKDHWSDTGH